MKQWYCVRTKSRQERIAHERLAGEMGVECFLPMITRVRRGIRAGQKYREALFPGYLFARVELAEELRKVRYAQGVLGFVHLGERYPSLADAEINALKGFCDQLDQSSDMNAAIREGDSVELVGRLFGGTKGKVKQLMTGKNRVRVLIEFLTRSVELDVGIETVLKVDE